ncbi:MAG: VWA domain-containing protein [Promethearchaeota archaeon]
MGEIKIFVDISEDTKGKIIICQSNADILKVQNGNHVEIFNPDNNKTFNAIVEISDAVLDFTGQFSKNIIEELEFIGVELIVRPSQMAPQIQVPPSIQAPPPILSPLPAPPPQSMATPPPQPIATPSPQPIATPPPQPIATPPYQSMPGQPVIAPTLSGTPITPIAPVDPYPYRININTLQAEKNGIILTPVIANLEGGRVQLSVNNLQRLSLGQGMLIAWEDPLTRAMGSARIDQSIINDTEILMSQDTKEETNIQSEQIIIYSTEPPIQKASEIMLEVQSQANLNGFCQVSPRTQHTLSIQENDIFAFEDELTGAIGAGKAQILEMIPDNVIIIDSEILEASGIGSFDVKVSKNQRTIIPLQSVSLGISPISGENMWEIISVARQSVDLLKNWLINYIIFKGIKLRWNAVNISCSIINCVPDLTGDILAQITPNTTISLSPMGLIPFNAILILDISRSMMARDVLVTNIAPAIEGIKAAMESREIQEFLKHFKDGIYIPRRISAAFAAVLFLSEKVGRGFGEKVSVIRFADEAQILPLGNSFYMDSASGKKGVLEDAARMIVDRIGNAYGQATNMGQAMIKAHEVLLEFERISPEKQPTMIVLMTDGAPTDGEAFLQAITQFSENPNVVIYILGLGNPDRDLMTRAAVLCGGEYFEPENAGELLIWYSKRARDLTVKLKAHK